jgi:hypothetical protein
VLALAELQQLVHMECAMNRVFGIVLAGALGSAAQAAVSKDRGVAGTYELLICRGQCSFSDRKNVDRTAVIAIFDRAIKRKDVEGIDSTYLDVKHDPARACYLLTYPNRQTAGVTSWTLSGQTLSFSLMHSPESWYSVRVERAGDLLKGFGNFWTAGVAPPPGYTPDTIVGRRRGPADISACSAKADLP